MKIAGIIAEYDPFHSGHAWQIAELRRRGYDRVVVCMSCSAVQRGGFSLLPPRVRVRAALQSGADLVLALPTPWSCSSAESFAAGGVAVLSALGCVDTLAFGAEVPDAGALMQVAAVLISPQFSRALADAMRDGAPFASARAAAAEALCPGAGQLLATPNNNLGVEYCKAIASQGSSLRTLAIRRNGAAHGGVPQGGFASGSSLRELWHTVGPGALRPYVPERAFALYQQNADSALDPHAMDLAILSRLRAMPPEQLAKVRGMGEGLEYRLADAVRTAVTLPGLYDALKTRRYAHARLRRLVLDAALGYGSSLPALPPYVQVLGAKQGALSLCGGACLPCGAGLARLAKCSEEAACTARAHAAAEDLAALCRCAPEPMGQAYTQKLIVEP